MHDLDHLGAVGRRQAASLVEDGLQLSTGQLIKVQLHEAVPESPGEHLEITPQKHDSTEVDEFIRYNVIPDNTSML